MSSDDTTKAAEAAIAVMNALQPLSPDERSRVLQSAAALFGVSAILAVPSASQRQGEGAPAAQQAPLGAPQAISGGKRVSLVELLKEKAPATNDQRIACFAYYREKIEGKLNFSSIELAAYFQQAKLPAPGPNYARDYKKAVKNAWIHDEGASSYLTQDGEAAVQAGFDGKQNPRKSPTKRKSNKSR
ncbi:MULTISPECIES: hypothetical protein [Lysobacter]|uniref:hypothetical protein n=1 Tax=Lysobacter TaxID=68 RepID=UPI001269A478|nr:MULTISPECIES: hypothetical protein [Lysobacter]